MIDTNGQLTLVADDFDQPNGLCFSDDESRIFVNDSMRNHIRVFDIHQGGTLKDGKVWATLESDGDGVPDGMKIDNTKFLQTLSGAEGIRTPDRFNAIEALSQLSYSPILNLE